METWRSMEKSIMFFFWRPLDHNCSVTWRFPRN